MAFSGKNVFITTSFLKHIFIYIFNSISNYYLILKHFFDILQSFLKILRFLHFLGFLSYSKLYFIINTDLISEIWVCKLVTINWIRRIVCKLYILLYDIYFNIYGHLKSTNNILKKSRFPQFIKDFPRF